MKKVFLHGDLGKGTRSKWVLNVSSPMEAIKAININSNGKLIENISRISEVGGSIGVSCLTSEEIKQIDSIKSQEKPKEDVVVQVLTSQKPLEIQSDFEEIHIMPSVEGSFVILPSLTWAAVAKAVFMVAASMLIAGVAAALFPPVKVNNQTRTTKSYAFGDRPNIRKQGGPIPVGYGMLRVGSITSSFSRRNKFLPGSINSGVIESYTSFVTHDLISEGPIEGFCDSNGVAIGNYVPNKYNRFDNNPLLKAIYINDVKLMNDQGELNIIPNEKTEKGGEVQPAFSLGSNSEMSLQGSAYRNPVYGIDFEKKGQSPLMGPDTNVNNFAQAKSKNASAFTYSVSDRNVGILTLNLSSERMFYNWTDKRVRRRFIGRSVKVTQGTDPVVVKVGLRVFDGKKYVSPIDVAHETGYSQLEDIEQSSRQNYTSNFSISNLLGSSSARGFSSIDLDVLSYYFAWVLFEVLESDEYYFSNKNHGSGVDGAFSRSLGSNLGPSKYQKSLKYKIFDVCKSAQDFVEKFRSAYQSNIRINFYGENKSLKELFSSYFNENKRVDYSLGTLSESDKGTISKGAEVLGALASQTSVGLSAKHIVENNFHLCMSFIKLSLPENSTLGNNGIIYNTITKLWKRPTAKKYYSGIWAIGASSAGVNLIKEKDSRGRHTGRYYAYTSTEYITEQQYQVRNSDNRYRDDAAVPWSPAGDRHYNQSVINIKGISTAPASLDFNIQLPYIAEGESLTLQVVRFSGEITGIKEQQEKQKRLALKGIRQHCTILGKRMNFSSPSTAWIATEFDSVNFQNIPDRNYLVKLKKVAVPNNYNTYSRSCIGAWNGLFNGQRDGDDFDNISEKDLVWTDNPAWVLLDILTNTRFGVGKSGLRTEDVDIWNLYNVAKFCDELVETGFPTERPVRKFITDNESPQEKKSEKHAQGFITDSNGYTSDYWKEFSKARVFDIIILDENGGLISSEDFEQEFNQGFNLNNKNNPGGNAGKTIAFFMEDGTVERRVVSGIDINKRKVTLYGPSFVDHPSTEKVSTSSLSSSQIATSRTGSVYKTEGTCVSEISYPIVEPRFSVNTLYSEQESALDVVRELTSAFRTVLNYMNGQISFSPENFQEPAMLFTDANVDKDGFAYSGASKTSRVTVAKVTYADKFDDFKSKVEYYEDPSGIDKFGYIEQDMVGVGCTSRGQAQRLARFMVTSPQLESEVVSFKCGIEGSMIYPGAIIEISDKRRFGQNVNGRIKKVFKESRRVVLDKIVSNIKFYDPVTDKDNDRVELCVASPQGFEEIGNRASPGKEATGLYKKMKILANAPGEFDREDQEALISATKKSQIIYFDGFLSSNKREVVELRRKYKFSIKTLSKSVKSVYHPLRPGDVIKFISFGVLPEISYENSGVQVHEIKHDDYFRVSGGSDGSGVSNHIFKIQYIKNYGSSNEEYFDVTFRDIGYVTIDKDVSGGEHFFYIEKSKNTSIDNSVESMNEVSVGAIWAIRGYRREFYGELQRQASNVEEALNDIGANSIVDSKKYHHDLLGEFTVTRCDSVYRKFIQINQTSNAGQGLGGMSISTSPDGDFLRGGGHYVVEHFLLGDIRFLSSKSLILRSDEIDASGSPMLLHFYRPSLKYGVLRCETFKNEFKDYIRINGFRFKVFSRDETFTDSTGTNFTRKCNYIEVDDRISGPTRAMVDKAIDGNSEDLDLTAGVDVDKLHSIEYDVNDYRNVGRRQYRVNSISEDQGSYDIKASEYSRDKFSIIEKSLSLNRPSLPIPPQVNMAIPKAPSNVSIKDLTYRNE